jgi:hypothetical protein
LLITPPENFPPHPEYPELILGEQPNDSRSSYYESLSQPVSFEGNFSRRNNTIYMPKFYINNGVYYKYEDGALSSLDGNIVLKRVN